MTTERIDRLEKQIRNLSKELAAAKKRIGELESLASKPFVRFNDHDLNDAIHIPCGVSYQDRQQSEKNFHRTIARNGEHR